MTPPRSSLQPCTVFVNNVRHEAHDFGSCPDCGAMFAVILNAAGDYPEQIFHAEPTCDSFEQLDAGTFLERLFGIRQAERVGVTGEA